MNKLIAITIIGVGLSACTPQQIANVINNNDAPAPAPALYFPPCDPATGYYETSGKDSIICVQPPMRTDCADGQTLTKAGYFECTLPETAVDPQAPPDTVK